MKVLINRKPRTGPWGGGNHFVNAFYEHAKENGIELVEDLSKSPDAIFLFHPSSEDGGISVLDARAYREKNPHVKIWLRVNECDARKGTHAVDELWLMMGDFVDRTFFVSNWMMTYFEQRGWKCPFKEVIVNGVDRNRFERKEKLSLTNGKINLVCAHWSDNAMKGQQTYEFLDYFVSKNPGYTFTFIGRTKAQLKNSTVIQPLDPKKLAIELSRYDVCINGSMNDPGPNAVIESIAAGLPTYVTRLGGGGIDFAGEDHVFDSFEHLEKILLSKQFQPNVDRFEDWSTVMKTVFERIKNHDR